MDLDRFLPGELDSGLSGDDKMDSSDESTFQGPDRWTKASHRERAEILARLGERLRTLRKARKLTAQETARRAGLDRTTVHRAEAGDNATLLTLVRLLRVLGRLEALEDFLAPPEVSPLELIAKRKGERG